MKYYQSLFTRHKEQDASTAFAYFPFNPEEPWEGRLAKLAQEEDWSFSTDEFRNKYKTRFPILINYLNFSFLRTQEQGLITYSEEKDKACFNTGLITREYKDIYEKDTEVKSRI
jgi:hypothetical protein